MTWAKCGVQPASVVHEAEVRDSGGAVPEVGGGHGNVGLWVVYGAAHLLHAGGGGEADLRTGAEPLVGIPSQYECRYDGGVSGNAERPNFVGCQSHDVQVAAINGAAFYRKLVAPHGPGAECWHRLIQHASSTMRLLRRMSPSDVPVALSQ